MLKFLSAMLLFTNFFVSTAEAQYPTSCFDTYDRAMHLLDNTRGSIYFGESIVSVALRLKERAEELNDQVNFLRRMSDRNSTWRFLDLNQRLNSGFVDGEFGRSIQDSLNFIDWAKGTLNEVNEDYSKEQLLDVLRRVKDSAQDASRSAHLAERKRGELKSLIDQTQNEINTRMGPLLQEFSGRSEFISRYSRSVLGIGYSLVGDSYYNDYRLTPSSKLGRLESELLNLRACIVR